MSSAMNTRTQHMEKALSQIHEKPDIKVDFTQHQADDGTIISTQERVVKDVSLFHAFGWRSTGLII